MAQFQARAGRYEPEITDWWERAAVYVLQALARLWCWRELTLPALALVVAYGSGHHMFALAAGLIAACGVVLLALTRREGLVGVLRRCRARSAALSRHFRWPRVCRELGWARRVDKGGWLIPDLLSWRQDEREVLVQVRPLPEHGPPAWDKMADAVRRLVGGASVQWREEHGILTVVVSRQGLPAKLAWTPEVSDRRRVVIGQRHGGTQLALDVLRTPHLLLAGATGSGKGATIRGLLAAALLAGWQAVVLDPKESGEYSWLWPLGVPVYSDLEWALNALEELEAVRRRRQALIKQFGADSWHELPACERCGWRPVLLIVDEAADLLIPIKGKNEAQRQQAALQQKVAALIMQFARKGRSAGIHLVVAIQRPDTAQLGDQGGALRNNLTARLALGTLDAEGVRMLGISTTDPVITTLDGTPGRGICVGFGDDPRPSACQVAWLDQKHARASVKPTAPQGLGAIQPTGGDPQDAFDDEELPE